MKGPFPKGCSQFLLWVAIALMGMLFVFWSLYHARGRKTLPVGEKHYSSEMYLPDSQGTQQCFFSLKYLERS